MKKLMFLMLIMISINSLASGWITKDLTGKITYVNAERFDLVRIGFTADDRANPDECGSAGAVILKTDSNSAEKQYSLLLAAFMADKPIKLYGSGCISAWGSSFPELSAVYVYP
ncbi:hypothetical protein [Teredinibacter turnerae]|uniref:hypothetical protein n=1 Tax=Teredinibacter turnerae TaxID=2426 RepID=UPI0005669364|nr:hypothetical protein [Teredinibacter turnerae]